jgi:protoporphyrinogen/coproporphyrinogen III oxidase
MIHRVAIIGGGIAGLAAAHRLVELKSEKRLNIDVVLLEASSRLGGTIVTEKTDGFLVEAGPDSFITEKPWALGLCERLQLTSRLVPTQAAHQRIHIVHDGKLKPLPEGFFLLAPTRLWPFVTSSIFSWKGKLRMAGDLFMARRKTDADESLAGFVRRRFGAEALERVAQPLIGGIYAADPDKLSLAATMPRFLEMERRQRSVIYAMWSASHKRARLGEEGSGARWSLFVTLAGGMQELVDTLAKRLPEGSVRLNSTAKDIRWDGNGNPWRVAVAGNEILEADAVIVAAPADRAAALVAPLEPVAAGELKQIAYASTATVSLAYQLADFPRPPDSFGFVVPAIENREIMACTFSSLKYPGRAPAGKILLRAFVGGMLQQPLFERDDAAMIRSVRAELASLLGVRAEPLLTRVRRHADSMPQYEVGHQERVKRIEAALLRCPTLALAGSAYHGVGISDCVRTGEQAAETIVEALGARREA